eukprot:GHVR01020855.1.p1 GENE.GHVR01020855.1~~GHVR01020855.1.p1  ORF type:complete len:119 (-),score=7.17 GHVR01020855.1:362-718(-)
MKLDDRAHTMATPTPSVNMSTSHIQTQQTAHDILSSDERAHTMATPTPSVNLCTSQILLIFIYDFNEFVGNFCLYTFCIILILHNKLYNYMILLTHQTFYIFSAAKIYDLPCNVTLEF